MKTTRRRFLGTAAGVTASVAFGARGLGQQSAAVEDAPTRLIHFQGLRPTDPGGRLGLRNPERGWRIETVIAEPARKTFGPAQHLAGKVSPLYQEDWWMLDAARFEPPAQSYCYLTSSPASSTRCAPLSTQDQRGVAESSVRRARRFPGHWFCHSQSRSKASEPSHGS